MPDLHLAVDIGGTFTDIVILDEGSVRPVKTPTTPDDLFGGLVTGLAGAGLDVGRARSIRVGTTAGLNAFLQRRGETVGLICTRGFQDVYEIGRHNRPRMYDLFYRKPAPLVPRDLRLEVDERLNADGTVITPLDEESVARCADLLRRRDVRAVAVCLLHAYANPAHEEQVAAVLSRLLPEADVCLSSRVAREWREYERTSTTVINAYIASAVNRFLAEAERGLAARGYDRPLLLSRSSGGLMSSRAAAGRAVLTLFSGPAAGAQAAAQLGALEGYGRLVSLDMGGTSTDVSVIWDGEPGATEHLTLDGHPLILESVDIYSIGAGGGSIAAVRPDGRLTVGPESAGAVPGPACYGQGGREPTVTDANLILGRLPSDQPLSTVALDRGLAAQAIRDRVADTFDMNVAQAALGIIRLVDTRMAYAVREVTVERGRDARTCALVAFGGAGPQHACALTDLLGMRTILIPALAGVFSAFGMLQAPVRHDAARTFVVPLTRLHLDDVAMVLDELARDTRQALAAEGVDELARLDLWLDMRYIGQEYTIRVPLTGTGLGAGAAERLYAGFTERHRALYGHTADGEAVEVVAVRARGEGPARQNGLVGPGPARRGRGRVQRDRRTVIVERDGLAVEVECPWYVRDDIGIDDVITGPAIVLEKGATLMVQQGWIGTVSRHGTLVLTKEGG